MDSNKNFFGHVILPTTVNNHFLLVQVSDNLTYLVNLLHNMLIIRREANPSVTCMTSPVYAMGIYAEHSELEALFHVTPNPTKWMMDSIGELHGGAMTVKSFCLEDVLPRVCNSDSDCEVQYFLDDTIVFRFRDSEGALQETYPISLEGYHLFFHSVYNHFLQMGTKPKPKYEIAPTLMCSIYENMGRSTQKA